MDLTMTGSLIWRAERTECRLHRGRRSCGRRETAGEGKDCVFYFLVLHQGRGAFWARLKAGGNEGARNGEKS